MATECAAVTTALSHLQNIMLSRTTAVGPDLVNTFNCVIATCTLTLSVLDEYVAELDAFGNPETFEPKSLRRTAKAKIAWNEAEMKELCQQLQAHKSSITLLMTILQSESQSRTQQALQKNNATLEAILSRAETSRRRKAPSVLDDSTLAMSDTRSIIGDGDSIQSSTAFDFDDIIVNSRVYRDTMQKHRKHTAIASKSPLSDIASSTQSTIPLMRDPNDVTPTEPRTKSSDEPTRDDSSSGESASFRHASLTRLADTESSGIEKSTLGKLDLEPSTQDDTLGESLRLQGSSMDRLSLGIGGTLAEDQKLEPPSISPKKSSSVLSDTGTTKAPRSHLIAQQSLSLYARALNAIKGWRSKSPAPLSPVASTEEASVAPTAEPLVAPTVIPPAIPLAEKQVKFCAKCQQRVTWQFITALGGMFHLDCFTCLDCGKQVARKFFPIEGSDSKGQVPLCERDYFRRLDLLCHSCDSALRGPYITTGENDKHKFHLEHFTCNVCNIVFDPTNSYYEHEGGYYCRKDYEDKFAKECFVCQGSVLDKFVEEKWTGEWQYYHEDCYPWK